MKPRILLIDNYDSFTFNLVQGFRMLEASVEVYRNDQISVEQALALDVTHVVISPGPGNPDDAGISIDIIRAFSGVVPILGVCLGHQSLVAAFGGSIVRAHTLMHGKTSEVFHDGKGLFRDLPQPFQAGRYHSLAAQREDLPANFLITARTEDDVIMGVRDEHLGIEGVQFHPESVLTPDGQVLLGNFLSMRVADTAPAAEVADERSA
ncbi:MAG: aminodeoxychorismate/anthranilate synthase component II [Gammaproteobacteria bacterium]